MNEDAPIVLPEVSKPPKRGMGYWVAGIVASVAVVAAIVAGYIYYVSRVSAPVPVTKPAVSPASPSAVVSDLSTYKNDDYGFSFDYPKTLDSKGSFKLYVVGPPTVSEKGQAVCLYFVPTGTEPSFAKASTNRVCDADLNKAIMLGGVTLDYAGAGRDTTFFDLTGFKESGGKVALRVQNNPYGAFEDLASNPRLDSLVTNKNSVRMLAVKHSDEFAPGTFLEPGKGNKGDYVNLTGNTLTASGIIYLGGNAYLTEAEYASLLDSFKVYVAKK